ncbi:MAG: imidazole glycerol phosphate synthase subunit HisF, partial [Francisellaceae bacterium]|nr:imidazole glycerol phosphate synthase subunit HisF [Francisellaceae bacterium]
LNIDRNKSAIGHLLEVIDRVSEVCFMPLAIGGGIRSSQEASKLIERGADKVVINSICYDNPDVISKVSARFGRQAVVVAMDVKYIDGNYILFSDNGVKQQDISIEDHIKLVISKGAGEILVQSIDKDGVMYGFDVSMIKTFSKNATVPIIACGGAGNYNHLKEVFLETDVSAVACGSIFNFSDSNLVRAKAFLSNYGLQFKVV